MRTGSGSERAIGTVVEWNDARGFGFITPHAGGPRLFAHVSAFPRQHRPIDGCEVTYDAIRDDHNRLRATAIHYVSTPRARRTTSGHVPAALTVALAFFALLAGLSALDKVPLLLIAGYAVASVFALLVYADDKSAAQQGRWRIPESTLHLIAIVGGWPGALVARHLFRHKTTKEPFRTTFWITVLINCGVLAWLVYQAPISLL